jgi:putative heme iron utilization protein
MNPAQRTLRDLVQAQRIAALGTLHHGEPFVSMVPFAPLAAAPGIVIHVSGLSSHTGDMLASPRVSLMIAAPETPDVPVQALPRVTMQGDAEQIMDSAPGYTAAREAYLARFPHAAGIFELPDFSLFVILPVSIRVISGFGRASTLGPDAFAAAF